MAGLCDDAQVAEAWGASDLGPGVAAAGGTSGSAAAANTNKILADAQKKLRISQQQVWHDKSSSCACIVKYPA